ncbi:hypothetical protein VE04_08598, partial [Pseudogymnoascus sp. 24MN13]
MVSSVLGKRTRSSVEAALPATLPRPKRQAATVIYSDENDDPFAPRQTRAKARSVSSDVSLKSSPGKHSGAATRTVLQPTQIKKHFNTVKSVEADENAKVIQVKTPQTPRHRDALSKQVPTTPRHRVTVTGTAGTPRTPRTPSTPSGSSSTIYNVARQLFTRSSDPGRLIGREEERLELSSFINTSISTTTGGCTYVSGPPGTGKSAMVNEVIAETPANEVVKKAYVNCMSMKSSKDLYCVLLESLCGPIEVIEGEELQTLQGMFAPRKPTNAMYLITLDEIDHVVTLDLECMYKLFEWALQPSSHLIQVGVGNALDLTDRVRPRLQARNLKPNLLPFLPYTAAQIKSIITTRLKSLIPAGSATPDFIPFLHPAAIELCSRKVSAQTGDLRKAFDICRRAVDLIETETKAKHQASLAPVPDSPSKKILAENPNLSSPVAMPSPAKSPRHLSSLIADSLAKLTKAALRDLVALERRERAAAANIMATPSKLANAAPTIKQLYDTYCHLCCADSVLQPLTSTEFRDVVGSLETLSL